MPFKSFASVKFVSQISPVEFQVLSFFSKNGQANIPLPNFLCQMGVFFSEAWLVNLPEKENIVVVQV